MYFSKADFCSMRTIAIGNVVVSMWLYDFYSISLGLLVPSMECRVVLVLHMFCFQ